MDINIADYNIIKKAITKAETTNTGLVVLNEMLDEWARTEAKNEDIAIYGAGFEYLLNQLDDNSYYELTEQKNDLEVEIYHSSLLTGEPVHERR